MRARLHASAAIALIGIVAACGGSDEAEDTTPTAGAGGGGGASASGGTSAGGKGGTATGGTAGKGGGGSGGTAGKGGASGTGGAGMGGAGKGGTGGSGGAGKGGASGTGGAGTGGAGKGGTGGTGGASGTGGAGAGGVAGTAGQGGGGAGGAGGAGAGGAATCGDNIKNGKELCDGKDLGGATCASVTGNPSSLGTLGCFANNCTFDTSLCTAGIACNNGVKEAGEACDGVQFGTSTCASVTGIPTATGDLSCFVNCTIDASACQIGGTGGTGGAAGTAGTGGTGGSPVIVATCGNGVKDGSEACEGADIGAVTCATATGDPASTGTPTCYANCTLNLTACTPPSSTGGGTVSCGDGIKNGGESCDGTDFGIVTCSTALGAGSIGSPKCNANCTLDLSGCSPPGTGSGGTGGAGGSAGTGGAAGTGGSASTCKVTPCLNHVYQCGDCVDNDGDGLTDMDDPDCLGPCSNNESGFFLDVPGANNQPCVQDCYYDADSGAGNDDCYWNHKCDPNEVTPDFYPEAGCGYSPKANTPGTNKTCSQLHDGQSSTCGSYCGPITPNGCDCFGCCELPAAGGKYVWLGSMDSSGNGTCKLGLEGDPTMCHPCEPVKGCLNTCEKCELCLGKTTLPAECLPPPAVCGNNVSEGWEQCDGTDIGTVTCADITGDATSTGTVKCFGNCTLDSSGCSVPTVKCGDGVKEGLEQCDGGDIGNVTCAGFTGDPASTGSVVCAPNCTLDGSGCTVTQGTGGTGGAGGAPAQACGDGVKQPPEQCDGADIGGSTCASVTGNPNSVGTITCAGNCTLDASNCGTPGSGGSGGSGGGCGNGLKEAGEQCDGADLGGATCVSVTGSPDATGTLKCFPNCTLDTSGCSTPSGGGGSCGGQVCGVGAQPCGLSCQGPCPDGQYCLTGCCTPNVKPLGAISDQLSAISQQASGFSAAGLRVIRGRTWGGSWSLVAERCQPAAEGRRLVRLADG